MSASTTTTTTTTSSPSTTGTTIIVDIGTSCSRIGRSGNASPEFDQPRPHTAGAVWRSSVCNLENFDSILTKSGLLSAGGEGATDCLIVESVSEIDSLNYRSRMCELLFEERKLSGVSFQYAPVLSCFSNARQTGLVIDMSGGGCTASAVIDGWCLTQTNVERSDLGGEDIDSWLAHVANGPVLTMDAHKKLELQRKNRETPQFTLPDGTELSQKVSNALFDPTPLDHPATYVPLHELVFTAATKQTSNEIRRALLNNVVIAGGLSRTEGVVSRLAAELHNMAKMEHPRVISCGAEQRHLTSWIGGSILSSLPVFKELCISKEEFDESGPQIISKKCA